MQKLFLYHPFFSDQNPKLKKFTGVLTGPTGPVRAIRSGLVSGLVLVFTDPVSCPSRRRFCVPQDPAGSGAVHYPVQRGLSDFSLASALPVVPHRVPARWVSAEHGAAPTARCSGPNYSTHHGAIDRAEKSCT